MNGKRRRFEHPSSRLPRGIAFRSFQYVIALCGIVIFCVAGSATPTHSQIPTPSPTDPADRTKAGSAGTSTSNRKSQKSSDDDDSQKKSKSHSWIIAPIPINSPAFGAGFILAVGYVFNFSENDKRSPPSTVGAITAFTNNGSRGIVAGGKLYFLENKYQTTFAFGTGRANYEYFGIGRIPGTSDRSALIRQKGGFIFGEFLRNFGRNIFIGPRYQYRKLNARFDETPSIPGLDIPQLDLRSTTAAIGVHVQRDLRDSTFYPRKGSLLDFKADFFAKAVGSNRDYQVYGLSYNGYHSLGARQVLAYRGAICSVSEKTPFFDLCLYGARSDIRGYTAGEFQDRRMFATQAEYRRELPWRLGIVGFAGIGGIAPQWNKVRFDKLMPGAGVGLRFKLDKTNHINYRIDLGFGRSGHTLSFSVSEAF